MCLILQETRVQVQVLKSCKSVQESSEEVLFIKAQQISRQIYLSRFNIWSLIDSSTVESIENYEIQIFRSVFHAYPSYLCRVSFLTTLDIYNDYFKGHLCWCKGCRTCCYMHIVTKDNLPYFIFLLKKLLRLYVIRFCIQWASWFSSCRWTEELCSQHPSQVSVLVTYLEACIEMRDCHYITSPTMYSGKGSTVG